MSKLVWILILIGVSMIGIWISKKIATTIGAVAYCIYSIIVILSFCLLV